MRMVSAKVYLPEHCRPGGVHREAMKANQTYTTLRKQAIDLNELDSGEKQLVDELIAHQASASQWTDFANYYMLAVGNFYLARGLTRRQITELPVWKIAQDLNGRLMIAAGEARLALPGLSGQTREPHSFRLPDTASLLRSNWPRRGPGQSRTGTAETPGDRHVVRCPATHRLPPADRAG